MYFWLKLIHILSATIILGTGIGSVFYLHRAHKTANSQIIAFAAKNVVIADWIFTTPAIIIQFLTGVGLMHVLTYPWTIDWIMIALGLFILVGACWLPVVWLQIQIRDMAESALKTGANIYQNPLYIRYMKLWYLLGWPAFIAVIIIFYMMVFKPNLNIWIMNH